MRHPENYIIYDIYTEMTNDKIQMTNGPKKRRGSPGGEPADARPRWGPGILQGEGGGTPVGRAGRGKVSPSWRRRGSNPHLHTHKLSQVGLNAIGKCQMCVIPAGRLVSGRFPWIKLRPLGEREGGGCPSGMARVV